MITPAAINTRYNLSEPYLLRLQKYVRDTLSAYCERFSFAFLSRVKTLDSLCEKIESGRFPRWSEIDDLVAFCIVVPTLADESSAVDFLTRTFNTIRLTRRGDTKKSPQVFRFDSTRFVGTVVKTASSSDSVLDTIRFEVQVRTAFDHAWIVTTHALTYKAPVIDWRQQRLAAELKATTEKMDLLIEAFQEASVRIQESPWPEIQAKKDIFAFFMTATTERRLPSELTPKDWSRFVDNVYELGRRCTENREPNGIARRVIAAVDAELAFLGPGTVPVSLSLWQITLGSIFKQGGVAPFRNYWPLITVQLETLYPALRGVHPRFEIL